MLNYMLWQMLLPIFSKVADVVATSVIHDKSCVRLFGRCCCHCGRWNNHCYICNIYGRCYCQGGTDGKATRVVGWCVGRWNSQWSALI